MLPGVTVEARSDVLPSPRVAVSEAAGEYRLPALPPGNYTVTFTLSGMQTVTRQAQVQLGQDTVVDAALGVQALSETVNVTATVSLIERDSASLKSGVSNEQIMSLPVGPGVSRPAEADSRRAVLAGHGARPERRRQRPGQRLQLRRRQRHAAAVRHARVRAVVARHRAGHHRPRRRARRRLRSVRRLHHRLGQQVGHQPLHRRADVAGDDAGHGGGASAHAARRATNRTATGSRSTAAGR